MSDITPDSERPNRSLSNLPREVRQNAIDRAVQTVASGGGWVRRHGSPASVEPDAAERTIELLIEEVDRFHFALELIAFHEPQDDERAEAMRGIARRALLANREAPDAR